MAISDKGAGALIAIDIGNTRTCIGIFNGEDIVGHWKISSLDRSASDEYWIYLKEFLKGSGAEDVDGVVIASVVPRLTRTYVAICRDRLKIEPLLVDGRLDLGIELSVDRPGEVGGDRIANSVAACSTYRADVIVVDLGTATTFDVVSVENEYLGGVIAPGVETSAAHLTEKTAKLPQVEFLRPEAVIGRNTEDAIRSGLFFGAVGQIDGIVDQIIGEWGRAPLVVATGGLSGVVSTASRTITETEPLLTLRGLQIIYSNLR